MTMQMCSDRLGEMFYILNEKFGIIIPCTLIRIHYNTPT
ncbi:MAG: hypothetical protein ACI9GM_001206, partial [Salibacteraceae bacterium]